MWTTRSTSSPTSSGLISMSSSLELETRVAGAVGDLLDAAVKDVAVAVEHDRLDLQRDQLVADRLADRAGALLLRLAGDGRLERLLELARRRQHAAGGVVDRLGVDVAGRAEHRQPRPLGSSRDPEP